MVAMEIFEDVVTLAVRAHWLRGDLPFRRRQSLWFECPINMAALNLDNLKSGFSGGPREQLKLCWVGHRDC
jgi:hypothetical protein